MFTSRRVRDLCYCFTTSGLCNQKKITLTLTEECPAEACEAPEKICEEVEPIDPTCDTTSGPTKWPFETEPCVSTHQAFWQFNNVINAIMSLRPI